MLKSVRAPHQLAAILCSAMFDLDLSLTQPEDERDSKDVSKEEL